MSFACRSTRLGRRNTPEALAVNGNACGQVSMAVEELAQAGREDEHGAVSENDDLIRVASSQVLTF
jgi:hypothetical protein